MNGSASNLGHEKNKGIGQSSFQTTEIWYNKHNYKDFDMLVGAKTKERQGESYEEKSIGIWT